FHDANASDMEGNRWQDNGNGTFTSVEATARYSALDQYIMGLRPAAEVPNFFFIRNPSPANCFIFDLSVGERSCAPKNGVTVSGTRQNVPLSQVIAIEGARSPSSGFSGVNPTTTWKQAFILRFREVRQHRVPTLPRSIPSVRAGNRTSRPQPGAGAR